MAGDLGTRDVFERAIAEFSEAYAAQKQRDFEVVRTAEASGRITVVRGI